MALCLQSNPRYAGVYKNLVNAADKVSSTVSLLNLAVVMTSTCHDLTASVRVCWAVDHYAVPGMSWLAPSRGMRRAQLTQTVMHR